jgi:hypothetical protein
VEMNSKERFFVGVDSGFQQPLPEYGVVFPFRPQALSIGNRYPIHLLNRQIGDLGAHAWRHAEGQVCGARRDPSESPYFHQNFPKYRSRLLHVSKEYPRCSKVHDVRCFAGALPPCQTLKIQVQEEHRTPTSPLANAFVYALPKREFPINCTEFDRVAL